MDKGFGRLPSKDERDKNFPMRALIPFKAPATTKRYWYANGWWGDQGSTPQCVAYSLDAWLADGPVCNKGNKCPIVEPSELYHLAQTLDEWDGEGYEGTSVRGGAKALQQLGYISAYHWTTDLATMIDTILQVGPVVLGISWYASMSQPDSKGFIKAEGDLQGGHAIKCDGVDTVKRLFRLKQSWGRGFGKKGFIYLPFDDMTKLITEPDAEVMVATEVKK